MSGKYNHNNDFIIERILGKNEKSDIIFNLDEDGRLTNEIYCIVVKRGLSKENALKEAKKILWLHNFDNVIESIYKGRLDYDNFEGIWDFEFGSEYKSEKVWIIQTD